ncbi:MAG: hypothetical protein H6814_07255 [Phycisphaeraceae bacterium]|nr:hypothetical protein [Phycisphaeraceae bacterium]
MKCLFVIAVMILLATRVGAAPVPGVEEAPINAVCPVTGKEVGASSCVSVIEGHTVGFASDADRDAFLDGPRAERERFLLTILKPINRACPIDGAPLARCRSRALAGGFVVACCDEGCLADFASWSPGAVGAFVRETVEPINAQVCPMTGDDLVPDEPYYVAYQGRLLELCCDFCLLEWEFQPARREAALRAALGIEADDAERVALP